MILRWTTLLWLVAAAVAVGLVFQIKYAVQDLEGRLADTQARIHSDREALHVLRAEWSYLNQPQRIARLAQRHLEMIPLTAPQIGRIAALPPRPEAMDGRVFAGGPPVPPRHPGAPAPALRDLLPQTETSLAAGRPTGTDDPIGALVAATLQAATPETSSPERAAAQAEAPQIRKLAEPFAAGNGRLGQSIPRNPVTGAPLPVGHRTVSETR